MKRKLVTPAETKEDTSVMLLERRPWQEGDPTIAENVLIGALGNVHQVSLVGHGQDGVYIASTFEDPEQLIHDLTQFINILKEYL